MIILLNPPLGVEPLMLGANVDEAFEAMTAWGQPERLVTPPGASPELRVRDAGLTRDIFAHFEDGQTVTAIEIWRPKGDGVSVTWEGLDIFRTPADDILAELDRRQIAIDNTDPSHPTCPDITLGFNRDGGPTADSRGMARYFESVLVAEPGYYTMELPGIYLPPIN